MGQTGESGPSPLAGTSDEEGGCFAHAAFHCLTLHGEVRASKRRFRLSALFLIAGFVNCFPQTSHSVRGGTRGLASSRAFDEICTWSTDFVPPLPLACVISFLYERAFDLHRYAG